VPLADRAPLIRRYLLLAPGARPNMPVTWRSPLAAIESVAAEHPVFRVDRR